MKTILVSGANGQLGQSIQEVISDFNQDEFRFLFLNRSQLDVGNREVVDSFFFSNKIDYCINCAAYTAVDLAETEVEQAFQINADAVKYLAQACAEQASTLIHISTDYVFDGSKQEAYLPSDTPNPINVYGKSKLLGEQYALEFNPKSFVVRTSWVYSPYGKNFYTTMLRLMAEREELNIVSDQIGKPTDARDLARYLLSLIWDNRTDYGIHHFSGQEQMSWFEFAQKIAQENGLTTRILPISTEEYPTPAKRPKWSVLG